MELGNKNWSLIVLVSFIVAVIVAVLALVIYDNTMTPSTQQDDIKYINEQLSKLIVGYSPPA